MKEKRVKKGRPKNAYYSVYDLEDNIIITGEICDICKRLDIVKSTVSKALKNNSIIRRKYKIYPDYDDNSKIEIGSN